MRRSGNNKTRETNLQKPLLNRERYAKWKIKDQYTICEKCHIWRSYNGVYGLHQELSFKEHKIIFKSSPSIFLFLLGRCERIQPQKRNLEFEFYSVFGFANLTQFGCQIDSWLWLCLQQYQYEKYSVNVKLRWRSRVYHSNNWF